MLGPLGPVVGRETDTPQAWLAGTDSSRNPLVLAPSSARGWFGGTTLVALDPVDEVRLPVSEALAAVGAAAESAKRDERPRLVVAAIDYEGAAHLLTYVGGLVRADNAWRTWGVLDTGNVPDATRVAALPAGTPLADDPQGDMDRPAFVEGVEAVREAVAGGYVYVLNLTYRISGRAAHPPAQVFASLLDRGASDMSAALVTPERSIVSISPERFLALDGREARIEPIKGTRPRGSSPEEDAALVAELAADPKERAEHVMVVDLERNDLGRVCEPGTVHVDPLYEVVPTPYCHQLVSTVRGTVRADATVGDLLSAAFPCGSVTGTPKISAMEHIARLEPSPRGAYCGTLLVAGPGHVDSSVLIRTAEISGERATYGTGGGITYDSDPEAEWEETLVKSRPFTGYA